MIGRTPEYLGKKIGPRENKMIILYAIAGPLSILTLTAAAISTQAGLAGLTTNDGAHGLTEIVFGFASCFANNGQSFAGLSANTPFYNIMTAVAMMVGRFGLAIPALIFLPVILHSRKNRSHPWNSSYRFLPLRLLAHYFSAGRDCAKLPSCIDSRSRAGASAL
jgi:K+-transporting ATPase A subunit